MALAAAGANLNAASDDGKMTPLHAASFSGHVHALEAVQALLAAGAATDAKDL